MRRWMFRVIDCGTSQPIGPYVLSSKGFMTVLAAGMCRHFVCVRDRYGDGCHCKEFAAGWKFERMDDLLRRMRHDLDTQEGVT